MYTVNISLQIVLDLSKALIEAKTITERIQLKKRFKRLKKSD